MRSVIELSLVFVSGLILGVILTSAGQTRQRRIEQKEFDEFVRLLR